MAVKEIKGDLEKIGIIVDRWEKAGEASAIETQIVLDKLRSIYEMIYFEGIESLCDVSADDGSTAEEPTVSQVESVAALATANAPTAQASLFEEPGRTPEKETEKPSSDEEIFIDMPQIEVFEVNEEGIRKESASDELLFRHRHDRKSLLSLYGDSEQKSQPEQNSGQQTEVVSDTLVDVQAGEDVLAAMGLEENFAQAADTKAVVSAKQQPAGETKKVLGEVFGSGQTLADVYARNNDKHDLAEKIKNGKVESIRSAIGINDKFLLVRDLFAGDQAAYDKTMKELDSFDDLDDSLLYIHDNHRWNPDSAGALLLIDLLTRKFS